MTTQQAKHTPGPWQRSGSRRKLGVEDCIAVGPDRAPIIFLPIGCTAQDHAEAIKDADLCAAAPDMLKALRKAVLALAHVCESDPDDAKLYGDAYTAVSAAISRAGEA